jgi:octaprenyl-diphosphate synthase
MATVISLEGKRKAPSLEPLLSLCADDIGNAIGYAR